MISMWNSKIFGFFHYFNPQSVISQSLTCQQRADCGLPRVSGGYRFLSARHWQSLSYLQFLSPPVGGWENPCCYSLKRLAMGRRPIFYGRFPAVGCRKGCSMKKRTLRRTSAIGVTEPISRVLSSMVIYLDCTSPHSSSRHYVIPTGSVLECRTNRRCIG